MTPEPDRLGRSTVRMTKRTNPTKHQKGINPALLLSVVWGRGSESSLARLGLPDSARHEPGTESQSYGQCSVLLRTEHDAESYSH